MNNLTIADVDIPIMDGNIGMGFSGGTDSALLLYVLMSNVKTKLHLFTYAKNDNFRANALSSFKVLERCIQLTGNNNIQHHVRYETGFDKSLFFETPVEYTNSGKIDYVYTGLTKNPPNSVADAFLGTDANTQRDRRDPEKDHDIFDGNWVRPFCNVNKQVISEMYDILKIKDTLFPLTFSCENVTEPSVHQHLHCDDCWWCKERKWGFGTL